MINPDGQRGTLTGGYRFVPVEAFSATASPSLVASGAQLTMTWVAPNGRGCNGGGDWIALYKVGRPTTRGPRMGIPTSGSCTCAAPPPAHRLSARRFSPVGTNSDTWVDGTPAVARSGPVTVTASALPSVLLPTLSVDEGRSSNRQILVQREWL